jgi:hypothetical protein
MPLALSIAGQGFHLQAPPYVLEAARQRFCRFEATTSGAVIELEVRPRAAGFSRIAGFLSPVAVRPAGPLEVEIAGAVRGRYAIEARRGLVENAGGLADVDVLLRVALSVSAPLDDALSFHAAAIPTARGEAIALCGASGAGKSTASQALAGLCDEMVILRPTSDAVELHSTPYWRGSPFRARCRMVVCLERGGRPSFTQHRGSAALGRLARHVFHHLGLEVVDRAILDVLCRICERTRVATAVCPEGNRFLPFLRDVIAEGLADDRVV